MKKFIAKALGKFICRQLDTCQSDIIVLQNEMDVLRHENTLRKVEIDNLRSDLDGLRRHTFTQSAPKIVRQKIPHPTPIRPPPKPRRPTPGDT